MATAKATTKGAGALTAEAQVLPPMPPPQVDETPHGTTPPEYVTGAVKQDPETLAVAVRTNIPDPDSNHDWGVMTVDRGGHYAGWDEVSNWPDIARGPGQ